MESKDLAAIAESAESFTTATTSKLTEQSARLMAIEQKIVQPGGNYHSEVSTFDIGSKVVSSDQFKSFVTSNGGRTGKIDVGTFSTKSDLLNATGLNQPLVPAFRRPGVIAPGQQRLTIRNLLPNFPI